MDASVSPSRRVVACVIYRGDYPQIGSAFATLGRWLLVSGYETTGPCREVYHRSPAHTADPAEYVTEIQYPVAPAQPAPPQAERKRNDHHRAFHCPTGPVRGRMSYCLIRSLQMVLAHQGHEYPVPWLECVSGEPFGFVYLRGAPDLSRWLAMPIMRLASTSCAPSVRLLVHQRRETDAAALPRSTRSARWPGRRRHARHGLSHLCA